jgi:hypothetical protein
LLNWREIVKPRATVKPFLAHWFARQVDIPEIFLNDPINVEKVCRLLARRMHSVTSKLSEYETKLIQHYPTP